MDDMILISQDICWTIKFLSADFNQVYFQRKSFSLFKRGNSFVIINPVCYDDRVYGNNNIKK